MNGEDENEQIIPESNIVYTRAIPCSLRNQESSCTFNALFQALSGCSRILEWLATYPSVNVVLENASLMDLLGWRTLRTLEDIRAVQLNQLNGQDQLNVHTARFSLPSCLNRKPEVSSWATDCSLSSNSGRFVNWIDDGAVSPTEFLWSLQEEKWSDNIDTGQDAGQHLELVIESVYDAIDSMERQDTPRQLQKIAESHLVSFLDMAYTIVQYRRTCTNPQCEANETVTHEFQTFVVPLLENTTMESSILQGIYNMDLGAGQDCPDCLTKESQQAEDVSFRFPQVLSIVMEIPYIADDPDSEVTQYQVWEELNEPLHLPNGPKDQPDNEKQWRRYRLSGMTSSIVINGEAHEIAYIKRDMQGRGPTWILCNDEEIDLLRPDELANYAGDERSLCATRGLPDMLFYELDPE